MTAMIFVAAPSGRLRRPGRPGVARRPNYALRRAVAAAVLALGLVIAAFVAIAVVDAATDLGGQPAVASEIGSSPVPVVRVHVAEPGDTLWAIADLHRGEIGRSKYVDALVDLNGGASIQVGQAVRLP